MKFKKSFNKSKIPKKQRKFRYNAPLHLKKKFLTVHLNKELKKTQNRRSLQVKKGDKIKILRGNFKGKTGIVEKIDIKKEHIFVHGVETIKKDGSKVPKTINASNIMIISLNQEGKKRNKQNKQIKNAKTKQKIENKVKNANKDKNNKNNGGKK